MIRLPENLPTFPDDDVGRKAASHWYNAALKDVRDLNPSEDLSEMEADNAKAADRACLAMIAQGYYWNGEAWVTTNKYMPPQPGEGVSDNPYCNDADCNDPNSKAMRWHREVTLLATPPAAAPVVDEAMVLREAATKALAAMERAKRLLKAAGFAMEAGTISEPYNEAMAALTAALTESTPSTGTVAGGL